MIAEVSILVVCLFIVLFIGMGIAAVIDNGWAYFLSPPITLCVVGLAGYLYGIILESSFDVSSASVAEILKWGFIWFLGLSALLMFGFFAPTHTTKSDKADKRFKDNPAVSASAGMFILWFLICTGVVIYFFWGSIKAMF